MQDLVQRGVLRAMSRVKARAWVDLERVHWVVLFLSATLRGVGVEVLWARYVGRRSRETSVRSERMFGSAEMAGKSYVCVFLLPV